MNNKFFYILMLLKKDGIALKRSTNCKYIKVGWAYDYKEAVAKAEKLGYKRDDNLQFTKDNKEFFEFDII